MNLTSQPLARFAATFPAEQIPSDVTAKAEACFGLLTGLAVMGCQDGPTEATVEAMLHLGSAPHLPPLGRTQPLGIPDAPIATAVSMLTGARTAGMGSDTVTKNAVLVAASVTTAEYVGATGSSTLAALAIGIELAVRIERAVRPRLTGSGWDPTLIATPLGATACAGRLLGLDAEHMLWALGISTTQAATLSSATPSGLARAKAAGDAVEAAVLAHLGLEGPAQPLEGRRGLAAVLSPHRIELIEVTSGLGERWHCLEADALDEVDLTQITARRTLAASREIRTAPDLRALSEASRQDAGV